MRVGFSEPIDCPNCNEQEFTVSIQSENKVRLLCITCDTKIEVSTLNGEVTYV